MVRLGARSLAALLLVGLTACATPQGGSEPRLEDVDRQAVKLGAERLLETGIDRYAGQRVGLIAHSASILGGQRLVDLLAEREEIELVALFGPEHGFGGTAAAGEEVAEGRDAATGLPVFSLYGETKAPTPESLAGVDVLFFDLQDVGARYFTYISTMGLAMQAAARAGVRFVVLDRPNPLGGELVEGFVLDVEEHRSFVGYYPIPAVHGLTVGELARMIVGEAWLEDVEELELDVVAMSGWTRGMQWPDTGLPWVPPSPNLATFEAALHYPGTCLFEGTVFSEGRGTETPFELFGAPRLETSLFDGVELAGVRLEATTVTPVKSWRSGAPRFEGLEIPALRLVTMDRRAVRPLANGVEILTRLRDLAADLDEWVEDEWFDQLAGSGELRAALQAGASSTSLEHAWAASVQRYRLRRDPYLIYGSN